MSTKLVLIQKVSTIKSKRQLKEEEEEEEEFFNHYKKN